MSRRFAVIVSLYDQRPIEPIGDLLASIARYSAGLPHDVYVVVNRDDKRPLSLPSDEGVTIIERANTGMNIGAWDFGWRHCPGYDGYLFLQDECVVRRNNWLAGFVRADSDQLTMVGESLNTSWDRHWDTLRHTHGSTRMRQHTLDGAQANRIDIYLDFMSRHNIDPGDSGAHLRSLVWYLSAKLLARIDGFPIGNDFGECIGSEIGVSRKVISLGGHIQQVRDQPFHFIRHAEWNQRTPGGPFIHGQERLAFADNNNAGLLQAFKRRLSSVLGTRLRQR